MSDRMRRVNEAMREVLSDALTQDLKDPRVGFVTVTAVDTSPDLSQARVYVSVLAEADERRATIEGCSARTATCSGRVATQLRLKRTPTLQFEEDETVRRADRIERIIGSDEPEPEAAG